MKNSLLYVILSRIFGKHGKVDIGLQLETCFFSRFENWRYTVVFLNHQ